MKLALLLLLTTASLLPANFVSGQAKLPIPNKANLAAIQPLMNEVAKTIIEQHPKGSDAPIAAILAIAATETDPTKKYAVLQQALNTAIKSGLADSALKTTEAVETAFQTEPYVLRFDMIKQILPNLSSGPEKLNLLGLMLEAARDATEVQDYKTAEDACAIVLRNLPKAQLRESLACITKLRESIQIQKSLDANYVKAMRRLGEVPDDAESHAIAGKYTFFTLDDPQQALQHFEESKDPALEAIATLEEISAPTKDQLRSLADLWWNLSTKEPQIYQTHAVKRAAYWYMKFVDELNGVDKALALSRIEASYTSDRLPFIQHNLLRPGLRRDVANGTVNESQGVLTLHASAISYCQFIFAPPDNYDVEYHFTRTSWQYGVFFNFPCQKRPCTWSHNGTAYGASGGFHAFPSQPNVRNWATVNIADGKSSTLLLKIRTDRFQCFLDGTLIADVRDPFQPNFAKPNDTIHPTWSQTYLAVGDYWGNLTVTKAVLTELH